MVSRTRSLDEAKNKKLDLTWKNLALAGTWNAPKTAYHITLKRTIDMNDKSTWCKAAAFSHEAGAIFLGAALDCDASSK